MKSLKPPCVIVVGSLLPSLRVMVARRLIDDYGLKPIQAAKKMDVTPAAITQYVKGLRGSGYTDGVFEREDVKRALNGILDELTKGEVNFPSVIDKICGLCKVVRREGLICGQCMDASPALRRMGCEMCRH